MRTLHFVRHGPVTVDLNRPSEEWELTPDARPAIAELARKLSGLEPRRIISSHHVKATQTAGVLADILQAPVEVKTGLEEHHRDQKDFFSSRTAFDEAMAAFFRRPEEIVLGRESARMARDRFAAAIDAIMAETDEDEMIVTHGAVMAVYLASAGNGPAEDIWRRLGQPDHLRVEWPGLQITAD